MHFETASLVLKIPSQEVHDDADGLPYHIVELGVAGVDRGDAVGVGHPGLLGDVGGAEDVIVVGDDAHLRVGGVHQNPQSPIPNPQLN